MFQLHAAITGNITGNILGDLHVAYIASTPAVKQEFKHSVNFQHIKQIYCICKKLRN